MTTLLAVVSAAASPAARRAAAVAVNVSFEPAGDLPPAPIDAVAHLTAVWRRAASHGGVYTLVDADPFAPLVEAWAARLEDRPHELELVIGLSSELPVPDYYLVDAALAPPPLHWYADHLANLAPSRVIVQDPGSLLETLAALPFGRGLPDAGDVAASARSYVPLPSLTSPS